jgi:type I restriction-modification system DNA methylase subunit
MPKTRQLALPLETHRNHYLFSDHFLNEVLPGQDVWRESEAEARKALDAIVELYSRLEDALPHYSEAALEQEWIRPILDLLGHVYHVQPSLTGAAGTPDYAFFTDEPAKQAATPMWGTPAFWQTVLAVGDAKRWDRPLDKRIVNGAPDAFTNANPCFQIDYYLRRTGCAWGMISNGRRWRLYHRDTSVLLDHFYEVDLVQLIEQGDLAAFRYFYLFFRAAAFRPDAEGRCLLDEVLDQSAAYAVHVGDELKERVYEALRLLAQGFLDYPVDDPEQALDPATDLPRIHDACLILLYRLLFLLYAESRGLLPLDNPSYAGQYSLKAIKEDVARKLDEGVVYLATRATIWDDLRTLFDIIYSGQEALGVPAYDGRLFNDKQYPFLAERTIGDWYLAQAIDLLARAEAGPGQGLSFVDYRDLQVRHLGSIYEGLLEYKLTYAAEEMAVVRRGKKKSEEVIPSLGAGEGKVLERIPAGQVYLVTDRGERKATGSYYTPDYIVKYIVEQTLGPLADAQAEAVEREIAALKAKNKGAARRTRAYTEELARLQNSFADRALGLNVLDPAMGSGHFLVEATDCLARRIVEAGVVTDALADSDEESELSYWRRRVVERCIYGVDLNPLAVELAKLSLWLATVAKGKPLSFLDHHLRCGNSLIGARVADLQALPVRKKRRKREAEAQQLAMWDESAFTQDVYRVVGAMRQIQEYETTDLVSVKEKERLFEETVERERDKWRAIADLWTATYFGLELRPALYNACVQYVQGKPVLLQAAQAEAVLDQAHEIWEGKRFFHWEIEFPEVFFDQYGRHRGDAAGFDAVVGNPPYGLIERLAWFDDLQPDAFVLFWKLAMDKCRSDGYLSLITPSAWLTGLSYQSLRQLFLTKANLKVAVGLPYDVFPDAYIDTCIVVAEMGPRRDEQVMVRQMGKREDARQIASLQYEVMDIGLWRGEPNRKFVLVPSVARLQRFMTSPEFIDLGELVRVERGVQPYSRRKHSEEDIRRDFLRLDHPPVDKPDVYYPELLGEELSRYQIQPRKRTWLKYSDELANKRDEAYFNGPRVVLRRLLSRRRELMAATTDERLITTDNILNILVEAEGFSEGYMAALLNSKLLAWLYTNTSTISVKDDFPQVTLEELKKLPIRRIAFTTPLEERERLVEEGLERYEAYLEHGEDVLVRAFVAARLSAEPEQADVMHDILAHLAGRMIEMHKEKQAEVRGLLDWLAGYTGRPIDQWALKTHLRSYYEHDWAEMARILKRNQRKLPKVDLDVDAYKNEPTAKIRAAWETSMDTLRPLLARIEATDRLIDRIVYQLYGLTEEEIAVVEGRS